jgi:CheY-like chemotaxis protein
MKHKGMYAVKLKPMVMLVEDDRTMASLLRILLEIEGYQVVVWEGTPESSSEAGILGDIKAERPDLVLLDAHIFDINGLNILHQLRADEQNPKDELYLADRLNPQDTHYMDSNNPHNIHILVSSGLDLFEECKAEKADAFILKPFMPDELIELIHEILLENGS